MFPNNGLPIAYKIETKAMLTRIRYMVRTSEGFSVITHTEYTIGNKGFSNLYSMYKTFGKAYQALRGN